MFDQLDDGTFIVSSDKIVKMNKSFRVFLMKYFQPQIYENIFKFVKQYAEIQVFEGWQRRQKALSKCTKIWRYSIMLKENDRTPPLSESELNQIEQAQM